LSITCRTSLVRQAPGKYETATVEVDDPRQDEIRVKMVSSGLCHSDDHIATGDIPVGTYPFAGGHEGGGVVESVGPNTSGFEVGDKVVFSFLPACGKCRWCATGHSNLCDLGAGLLSGMRWDEPTTRLHLEDGSNVGQMCGIGTFTEYTTVAVDSAIKVPEDTKLEVACLLGCSVGTGWGSAVNTGDVQPGAVKREKAQELGATHAVESIEEATEIAKGFTNGQGADVSIVTIGITKPEHVGNAFASIRKQGTVIVTGLGDITEVGVPIPIGELTLFEKKLKGSLFGSSNPRADIPKMLDLYNHGKLKLDELVTKHYKIDEVAQGYEDMHAGKNIRGVLIFD
jgi:Zn-dependent alcohol dehydrogenase